MSRHAILAHLKRGPATNRELQDAVCDHGGSIARTCNQLMVQGRICRIDGAAGRGTRAIYALNYANGDPHAN